MALDILAIFIVGLIFLIPGVLLSLALLRGVKLNFFEKAFIGGIIGSLANPLLSVLEFSFIRLDLTASLVLINALILIVISIIAMFLQKQLKIPKNLGRYFSVEYHTKKIDSAPMNYVIYALLLIIILMSFYVRFASSNAVNFFEFDPYYYDKVTELVVTEGHAPLVSQISYFPRARSFRELPIIHYMTGSWYLLYQGFTGKAYLQNDLIQIIQFYPPLVGMFMVFLAFLFIKEESSIYLGLIAAALFAFTPQLIKKLAAGVTEQSPLGIFAAMFIFCVYALAVNRKSYRLAYLAVFSIIITFLGSAHNVWPIMILSAFMFVTSILDYYLSELTLRDVKINLLIGSTGLIANALFLLYRETPINPFIFNPAVLFLFAAAIPSLILYYTQKIPFLKKYSKPQILAGFMAVFIIIVLITPLSSIAFGFINSLLRYAKADTPLNRTVQEENATSEGLFGSSFGVLNPNQLLLISTVLLIGYAALSLKKKSYKLSLAYLTGSFIIIFLNKQIDGIFSVFADLLSTSQPAISQMFRFIIEGDVFLYLIISFISVCIIYLYEEKRSRMTLLFLLAFFPTAYIGLSKVKYLLHLAFAVALALPFVLMIFSELLTRLNSEFKLISNETTLKSGILVFVLIIGVTAAYKQYETTSQSMQELQYSRISSDWTETTSWMHENLGKNYRIISWWDYGHWITFFGGTNTVLDPSNYFGDYDQLTATAFVEGDAKRLIQIMKYHNATHILLDSELVPKWGALVYLSGTFKGLSDDSRFDRTPFIPSTSSPGSSEYETEHYFEYVYQVLTQQQDGTFKPTACPGIIQKQMLYSSFGAAYCVDSQGKLYLLGQNGEQKPVNWSPIPTGDTGVAPASLGNNLFYNQRYTFINVNPDLNAITSGRLTSKLINSPFVNLFFYEKLEGFELAHKSPNGQVKIFKLVA
ncbi:MAG: STT3 domain-containing protein [Candidatus Micrarchaeota archaeon]